ncbi:sulfotransferase domain-containing protein [Opitutales bacterium]|nr:sulfotransferase domain-containing protein [Opitutales bacterium]
MELDFIIAGAQKSGTTTLHNLLRTHPDIYIPKTPQELHFFDHESNYVKGMPWFESHFKESKEEHCCGQTSPLYIYHPEAAQRIHQSFPKVKLIFILRNPVERAYSHYYHSIKKGYEWLSFEEVLKDEAARIVTNPISRNRFSYKDRGFYGRQLSEYLKYFSQDQIKVVQSELLNSNTAAELNGVFRFLDLPETGAKIVEEAPSLQRNASKIPRFQPVQRLNAKFRHRLPSICKRIDKLNLISKKYPPMPAKIKEELYKAYEEDSRSICELFDLDASAWKIPYANASEIKGYTSSTT